MWPNAFRSSRPTRRSARVRAVVCRVVVCRVVVCLVVVCLVAVWGPAPSPSVRAAVGAQSCVGLTAPVDGPVIAEFAPVGRYAGHWGIDIGAVPDTPVGAAASGVVTFAGTVAENVAVTVDHGAGLRTSYSYLAEVSVARGEWVGRGRLVGLTGVAHETEAVHFSVRVDGVYIDPAPLLGCVPRSPHAGLSLVRGD